MQPKSTASERRAFPRREANYPVQVVRPDSFDCDPFDATLLDISQTGLLLLTAVDIPVGEWIVVRPDQRGAGFGAEVIAIVDRRLPPQDGQQRIACRFPEPIDYAVLRQFT